MDELIRPLTARSRFTSWLTGVFSIIALLLALVGIYGTMSYTVGQRTREIGVRIALGANAPQIFGMVVGRALALVGVGLVAGVIGAVAASHGIRDLLFGVSPIEPSVFVVVAMLVMTTGALAAFLPARRAVRIDPMLALRDE
jgi:ABC-type antimicrobial peptide transport system permease subunit